MSGCNGHKKNLTGQELHIQCIYFGAIDESLQNINIRIFIFTILEDFSYALFRRLKTAIERSSRF